MKVWSSFLRLFPKVSCGPIIFSPANRRVTMVFSEILAKILAEKLARTWLDCNFCGWNATGGLNGGDMFEKYDVDNKGIPGGGGEYDVQLGFGWTNGVVLDLISKIGRTFEPSVCTA